MRKNSKSTVRGFKYKCLFALNIELSMHTLSIKEVGTYL